MNNYIIKVDTKNYLFFVDDRNRLDFYVLPIAENEKYNSIINEYNRDNTMVPDGIMINVIRLGEIGENTYGLVNHLEIEFPVNKIHWKFVQNM